MKTWTDIAAASNSEIMTWAEAQSWTRDMAACLQDAQWHAEGDVWTHTKMVCAELEKLDEWPTLDRREQLLLLFAGLFHDSGKPATTMIDPDTGRTRSPKHAAVGAEIARSTLRGLGCNLELREAICALVTYHGRPPFLLEKSSPEAEVIRLSWLVSNHLLYLFALADTRGRDTKEMTRPVDNLHLWKMVSVEQNCFDQPFPFANDHARFLFFRQKLSFPLHAPHEDFRSNMTLMSGLPGAGKDTWLARYRADLPVVSLDEIRGDLDVTATDDQGAVIQGAREQCREHLRAGRSFAFNATNISSQLRRRWIELASDYNARIEIVYIEPPTATILSQNRRRTSPVPDKVIINLLDRLEPPNITECHSLTIIGSSE